MEPEIMSSCNLCTKPLQDESQLAFSCNHTLCFQCVPYMIYRILDTSGIRHEFFNEPTIFKCMICNIGKINQLPGNLMKFFAMNYNTPYSKRKAVYEIKCEACEENHAIFCCLGCNQQKYCKECLKVHQKNKKFSQHRTISLDEAKVMTKNSNLESIMNCKCVLRRKMEFFCQKCQISVCKYCAKSYHNEHKQIPLTEILDKSKEIEFKQSHKKLSEFIDAISKFKTKILQSFEIELTKQNKNFDEIIDNLIKVLLDLKVENKKNTKYQLLRFQEKIVLIQESLICMKNELRTPFSLHPNKLYFLTTFFSELPDETHLNVTDFEVTTNKNANIEKIDELIAFLLKDNENQNIKFEENLKIKVEKTDLIKCYNNFQSDINEVLNRQPVLIIDKTHDFKWIDTNCYKSIILDEESLLIWPNYDELKRSSWITVFNISLKKNDAIIPVGDSIITVVGTYPYEGRLDSLKLLYCADDSGIFKVFDLSRNHKYQEVLKIQTNMNTAILSAIVFDDLFMEISKFEREKNSYVIISYNGKKCPLHIYKINGKNAGEKVKEIPNLESKLCYSFAFYYEELVSKCFMVCCFFNKIKIYDLSLNLWTKEIPAIGIVDFPKLIHKKRENPFLFAKTFLIFRQNFKEIVLVDIINSNVLSKISLNDGKKIYDLCLWNSEEDLFMIATPNSVKLLDIINMKIIGSKEFNESFPFNFTKILIKNKKTEKFNEHIGIFPGEEIKIY